MNPPKNRFSKHGTKLEVTSIPNITINEEGTGLYKDFASKPKILVTLQGEKVVKCIIEKYHFSFAAIITREVSLSRLEQLKMAIAKLKVPTQNILFVGDSENDAASAKAVGCLFHKITWKPSDRKNL